MRLLLPATAVSVILLTACSADAGPRAQSAESAVATTTTATTVTTVPAPAFSAPQYGLGLRTIPPGFVALRETVEGKGPGPGWTHAYQQFRNDAKGQEFSIAVSRNKPVPFSFDVPTGPLHGIPSAERVHGQKTYFIDLRTSTAQLQYGWVVEPDVSGWATTYRMTRAETLALARQVVITKPEAAS